MIRHSYGLGISEATMNCLRWMAMSHTRRWVGLRFNTRAVQFQINKVE
jgi:hypothetical protein